MDRSVQKRPYSKRFFPYLNQGYTPIIELLVSYKKSEISRNKRKKIKDRKRKLVKGSKSWFFSCRSLLIS